MAKGIRVNLLAKELGVESKAILHKLKEEGLSDAAQNHMSTLSLGLAESVREWFGGQMAEGGTAVETAAQVEVATKTKTARSRKKKEASAEPPESESTTAVAKAAPPAPQTVAPMRQPPAPEKKPAVSVVVKAPVEPAPVVHATARAAGARGGRSGRPAAPRGDSGEA